jgi:hypothetical protein
MSVSLKFHDDDNKDVTIEVGCVKPCEQIVISISFEEEQDYSHIYLDVSTAIKFSKELRKQIALLK